MTISSITEFLRKSSSGWKILSGFSLLKFVDRCWYCEWFWLRYSLIENIDWSLKIFCGYFFEIVKNLRFRSLNCLSFFYLQGNKLLSHMNTLGYSGCNIRRFLRLLDFCYWSFKRLLTVFINWKRNIWRQDIFWLFSMTLLYSNHRRWNTNWSIDSWILYCERMSWYWLNCSCLIYWSWLRLWRWSDVTWEIIALNRLISRRNERRSTCSDYLRLR